ncbi:MAG TPA: choice-of-anchor V domain-containing protein, partial [Ignavibacteriaceae bacterium]|nr:choice-of-anchor V domain-containing protein [Ignavibacteriaceae bacterium]
MKKNYLFAVVTIVIMSSFLFYAYEEGITGKTLKSSEPGCICHAETQSSDVNVIIDGPNELAVGQTAAYSVRISGGLLVRGGTNVAVSLGSLQAGDGMQKISGELTHTFPKLPQDNEVVFEFNYTAPLQPTTITMYANGNSVNFSGTEIGDAWNYAQNKSITIKTIAGQNDNVEESNFYLAQNYPNPFNPTT